METIPKLVEDPENIDLRMDMAKAAYLGGKSIMHGLCGYIHSFAHTIGAMYHIPHGNAIAIAMVPVLRWQQDVRMQEMADLAVACGLGEKGMSVKELSDAFINGVEKMMLDAGLNLTVPEMDEEDYPQMLVNIYADANGWPVPKPITHKETIELLNQMSGGNVGATERSVLGTKKGGKAKLAAGAAAAAAAVAFIKKRK